MSKICYGCGAPLQTTNPDKEGYTPSLTKDLCKRCFRLKNYGEDTNKLVIDNNDLIKTINKRVGVVFFFVDFLNLNAATLNIFNQINLPKVLLVSKCDLLRKEMKYTKIKAWLQKVYHLNCEIAFASSKAKFSSLNILKYTKNLHFDTCYLMGITNAGKSTYLNMLLQDHGLSREVLVSQKENTTLKFMKFMINDIAIYDTPGFTFNYASNLLNSEIKPISYNIKENTSIMLDNYFISFTHANKVVCYLNTPNLTREFKIHAGTKVVIPANYDLVIPGLGFVNIKEPTNITTNISNYEIRESLSGTYEQN